MLGSNRPKRRREAACSDRCRRRSPQVAGRLDARAADASRVSVGVAAKRRCRGHRSINYARPRRNCLCSRVRRSRDLRPLRDDCPTDRLWNLGPSRILVLGPDSSLAPIILGVVLPLSAGDPARAIAIASAMAVVAGGLCIIAGIARLGFITELLSKPIRYGYMNGIALAVLISQLPKLFGFKIESAGPIRDLWSIGKAVARGEPNWAGTILGLATLVLILLLKAHKRMGAILVAVILAMVAAAWFDLSQRYGVKVLGPVPQGLPQFALPWLAVERHSVRTGGRHRGRDRRICRHQRAFSNLRGANRDQGRSKPGDGGSGRRESGRRVLPGVRDQQQLVSDSRCRGGRRENASDGHRRRHGGGTRHRGHANLFKDFALRCARRRSSLPQRSGCSSLPTLGASIAFRIGNSGCR